jgi:transposase
MMRDEDLARRLVVRRGAGGNCTYDESAKRELIETCLRGSHSVAEVARTYGLNANQLHNWIALYRKTVAECLPARPTESPAVQASAFIPVVAAVARQAAPEPRELRLDVTLDNGVQADLRGLSRDDVLAFLPLLANLPCSVSTRR